LTNSIPKPSFLAGGGEMADLIREHDWTSTSLGSIDQWPANLRNTLGVLLRSGFPMFLFWGPDLVCFYNDAFRPCLGNPGRHPLIGKKASEDWADTWPITKPILDEVLSTGKTVKLEDSYWTFSYSPVIDDQGDVAGVFVVCVETTEKINRHAPLAESELDLRNIVQNAPVGICILDAATLTAETVNDSFVKVAGKPYEAIAGKYYWDAFAEARSFYEAALDGVAREGKTFVAEEVELMLIRNGREEWIYVSFVYAPILDVAGKVKKVAIWVIENTVQVAHRRKLEEAEKKATLSINSANLGVYEIDYATDKMYTDQRFKAIWGVGNADFSRADYVLSIHPDDRPAREQAHQSSIRTGQLEYWPRIVWPDGTLHWTRITGTLIYDEQNKPLKLIGVVQDITETVLAQKKIEDSAKSIRNMILQAPVAMCIFKGPSYVVSIANHKMIELWGKRPEDVLDKPIFEGLPESKDQGLEILLDNVYTTGETFTAYERPVTLPRNGKLETVYVDFVYEALEGGDPQTTDILAVAIDVTYQVIARQKIEEIVAERTKELAEANRHLERSNGELSQFAYITSHDLQEPIRKIATYASLLEEQSGIDPKAKNYLGKIVNATSRMHNLIRDVLSYSELSRQAPPYEPVDLQKTLQDTISEFELLVEQKSAIIRSQSLPTIDAIPLQMSQLFGNLLSNALKYARAEASPVISISCRLEPGYIHIDFSDNGIGFSQEYASQIFSIFRRLHRKDQYSGTGIGLAICKKIVENHGGSIMATSAPGQGATFHIVLQAKHR
jgi:PAS domain S-box-containing protein